MRYWVLRFGFWVGRKLSGLLEYFMSNFGAQWAPLSCELRTKFRLAGTCRGNI